jgi:hypothetical protein
VHDSDDENNAVDVVAPFADDNYPIRDSDFESDEDDDLFGDRSPGVSPTKAAQREEGWKAASGGKVSFGFVCLPCVLCFIC